ncbi:MAG TPA: tartrate-resistant acid phosphatase type 5 family protein [Candidatus Acidoferrales bacterium]|nr:tartrate-resistant acid phosphatase type 5 family protein [Candidatus Acidoferrales bacterium]
MKQTRREFVRTLFVATQAAAAGSFFLPRTLSAAEAKGEGLNFLLVGDWGRNGEKDRMDVATQMGSAAQAMAAKFIVAVGDNFYEDGVKSVDDPQWQSSFEKVYTAPSLQVRWQAILGNHDYHGNCDAQIDYSQTSQRWNMPARYYTRTERIDDTTVADFFYLDTTPMSKLDDDEAEFHSKVKAEDVPAQVAWFEAALKASTAPWKIVIAHHPVYSGGQHGDTPYIVKHILPLLEKYGVQAYFNGHDHDLQHLEAGKVNLFCTGGGSKPRVKIKHTEHTKFGLGSSGFITASLQADTLEVRMIDDKGQVLYGTSVARG